jgi:hypothetical protein
VYAASSFSSDVVVFTLLRCFSALVDICLRTFWKNIGPIFNGQAVLHSLSLEDSTWMANQQPNLRNIPEEQNPEHV